HGARSGGATWAQPHRSLDDGDQDLRGRLATLAAIGYRGPVGLQGFGLPPPARDHLSRSMAAWRRAQPPPPAAAPERRER
ncbi:MAG: hypothetical protein ACK5S5_17695, partial [Planctomycetota bacterium]